MDNLERMMIEDGWKAGYYTNCGVKYFSFRKNGLEIDWKDINEINEQTNKPSKNFTPWEECDITGENDE